VSDRDVTALQGLWSKWLTNDAAVLPTDHVRVDLLYAEDTRYVNARLYPLSADSFHYLLAMQLALCWVDTPAYEWGEIDEEVMRHATLSVRPCYKFTPLHLIEAKHHANHLPALKRHKGLTPAQELDLYAADAEAHAAALQRAKDALFTPEVESESEEDEEEIAAATRRIRAGIDSDDDDDANGRDSDATSSEYESSQATISIDQPIVLEPLTAEEGGVTETDMDFLHRLVAKLGVPIESINVDQVVQRIIQFHAVALNSQIPVTSPKYRYLLKRAYLHYLSGASSFYGNHFAEATLMPMEVKKKKKSKPSAAQSRRARAKGNKLPRASHDDEGDDDGEEEDDDEGGSSKDPLLTQPSEVLVAVSVGSLVLLDPETWGVRFTTPIWDIQDFSVIIGA
jgi:hypothetical protein